MEAAGSGGGSWDRRDGPVSLPQVLEHCPGVNNRPYVCETGHCCGETGCCTYYYELWWFWLLWTVLILLSCCCAYRHRRAKLRLQQQQRQREINLIAYQRACHYAPSMLDLRVLASFKLPAYEEVAYRPTTPPPPYSTILNQLGPPSSPPPPPPPPLDTPSPSSEPSSSCSCSSDCLTSASSSSFSVQVTDETGTSQGSMGSEGGSWAESPEEEEEGACGRGLTSNKQAVFSSYVDFFEGSGHLCWDIEEEEEEEEDEEEHCTHRRLTGDSGIEVCRCQILGEEEEHYRHRRLTGDSGIEVCRCQILDEEEEHCRHRRLTGDSGIEVCRCQVLGEEERSNLHDSPGCTERSKRGEESPCEKGGTEPDSPVQPV